MNTNPSKPESNENGNDVLVRCPECGMPKNEWKGDGYSEGGSNYCCQGCAEGTGCICEDASSREEVLAREQPRPGRQISGALEPQGELTGERDNLGTYDGIDEASVSPK